MQVETKTLENWWFLLEEETIKALDAYKQCGVLQKYHTIKNSISEGTEFTVSITLNNCTLVYDLFRGKKWDEHHINFLRNPMGYTLNVTDEATAEEICWGILETFNEREEEYAREMEFADLFEGTYYATHAEIMDEFLGIDVWLHGPSGCVPIQLKSSAYGQTEHKKHYPGIPSLVYNSGKQKYAIELAKKIYQAYQKGEILHRDTNFGTPS